MAHAILRECIRSGSLKASGLGDSGATSAAQFPLLSQAIPRRRWRRPAGRDARRAHLLQWWGAGVLGIVMLAAGCATNQSGQAQEARRAVTSIQKTRQELGKAQTQVDDVLGALNELESATPAALPAAYRTFNHQVAQTGSQADMARRRAAEMREQGQQYIESWEKETQQLSTPELKASATERRQMVAENYDRLREAARAMDQAYQPFQSYLRDIQKALALDLTPAGVKGAHPVFESARNAGLTLRGQIGNFLDQIDRVLAVSPPSK